MTQTTHPINATTTFISEDDLMAHSEDMPLFWVTRNGHLMKRPWNELSETEHALLREAQERAAYCTTFAIY